MAKLVDFSIHTYYNGIVYKMYIILNKTLKGGVKMKNVAYCVRLKEETLNEIKELAKMKKRPTGQMIRIIIEDYVEKINL